MTPILIIKTRSGFAVAEVDADVMPRLHIAVEDLRCFADLQDSYSYRNDGLLSAVREHFTQPEPAVAELKAA